MQGLLWFDDDKKTTLAEKVKRAADYYKAKYGRSPDTCLVNDKVIGEETAVGAIKVKPNRATMPDYFLVGVGEA